MLCHYRANPFLNLKSESGYWVLICMLILNLFKSLNRIYNNYGDVNLEKKNLIETAVVGTMDNKTISEIKRKFREPVDQMMFPISIKPNHLKWLKSKPKIKITINLSKNVHLLELLTSCQLPLVQRRVNEY